MTTSANSVGFAPTRNPGIIQRNPSRTPLEEIRKRAEARRVAQEEIRYAQLNEKAQNGNLTEEEQAELKYLTLVRNAEKMADLFEPKVCYLA